MKSRISTDLGDPKLLKLLKLEAQNQDTTVKEILVIALESYFAHRFETHALLRAAEEAFSEWSDPRDADYDKL